MVKRLLILLAVLAALGLLVANYQNLFKKVVPPLPKVVSYEVDIKNVGFANLALTLEGTVINNGGNGQVVVEAEVRQGKKSWTKTHSIYMTSHQTKDFKLVFKEITLLGGKTKHSVDAYALGLPH